MPNLFISLCTIFLLPLSCFGVLLKYKPIATHNYTAFPKDFTFGIGTSAYQNEGAWNVSGKSVNIWDYSTHTQPYQILDRSNADIACNSYYKIKEDIAILKQLKVHCYRFSISWTRVCPNGYTNIVNPDGVRYYNELINALLANNITPMVTIYHWDLPQNLQDLGGWANPALADIFTDYSDLLFSLFGDRVKVWTTFNEPSHVCKNAYNTFSAPFLTEDGIGTYMCGHTLLRGHGKTYRMYQSKYKLSQGGHIGMAAETDWYVPRNSSNPKDTEALHNYMEMNFGWFVHPVYSKSGNYPRIMRERIANFSRAQNYTRSRLPVFTKQELAEIQGSYDFLGLNHYTTFLITQMNMAPDPRPSYVNDANVVLTQDPQWAPTGWDRFVVAPWGIRQLLNYIARRYGYDIPIAITENGYAGVLGESLDDKGRIYYMNQYIEQVLKAMNDGVRVFSYTYWTLMDNFEWARGYTLKFGLYYVDFNSPNRTRIAKKSAKVYQNIVVTRRVDESFDPDNFAH